MLLSVPPLSSVLLTIRPSVSAVSRLLVLDVAALVQASIGPLVRAVAMELAGLPAAFVVTTVRPEELAVAFDLVLGPLAFINSLIREFELAVAMLHTVHEHSGEDAAIFELLAARSILKIVPPEA